MYEPGIRAQLMDKKTMNILNDFRLEGDKNNYHVLNLVSPGWTCGLPIADYVVNQVLNDTKAE